MGSPFRVFLSHRTGPDPEDPIRLHHQSKVRLRMLMPIGYNDTLAHHLVNIAASKHLKGSVLLSVCTCLLASHPISKDHSSSQAQI